MVPSAVDEPTEVEKVLEICSSLALLQASYLLVNAASLTEAYRFASFSK